MTRTSRLEKLLTHGVLLLGAAVFSFPFIWMVASSIKVPREMIAGQMSILPKSPRVQETTPYVDTTQFEAPERPEGVPEAVWEAAEPRILERLAQRLETWQPRTDGPDGNPPPADVRGEAYATEMAQGLCEVLALRISDDARRAARRHADARGLAPGDLDAEAIEAGIQAMLADVDRLVTDKLLRETFEQCYRRVCLGDVRVRGVDYRMHAVESGARWAVAGGDADLVRRHDGTFDGQEARFVHGRDEDALRFTFVPDTLPLAPEAINRVYVNYRGDESWAKVTYEVVRDGQVWRAEEGGTLFHREWAEMQLRWPDGRGDPMERKTYLVLEPTDELWGADLPFAVRLTVEANTWSGAWLAKITRNYRQVFREVPYARYIMTSFALVILNILLAIFSCTIVGYAFARLHWPGRDFCFGLLLATMMIPPQVTMIPGFLIVRYIGWYNTLLPLWVPAAFGAPFFIFLLRQFFKNIPADLEDAARIDGCGFLRIYWHVMLPLVKPTIATIAIFTFMGSWNNFMGPLIFVNDERLFPLALGLFKFNLRSGGDLGLMMAGSFMMTLPIIALFFFVQRYFIQGISLTGTKG